MTLTRKQNERKPRQLRSVARVARIERVTPVLYELYRVSAVELARSLEQVRLLPDAQQLLLPPRVVRDIIRGPRLRFSQHSLAVWWLRANRNGRASTGPT